MLLGNHDELAAEYRSHMKRYSVHRLKTSEELGKKKFKNFTPLYGDRAPSYIQFQRPFLYSVSTWYMNGCFKNVSQVSWGTSTSGVKYGDFLLE